MEGAKQILNESPQENPKQNDLTGTIPEIESLDTNQQLVNPNVQKQLEALLQPEAPVNQPQSPQQAAQHSDTVQSVTKKTISAAELQSKFALDNPKSTDCFHNSALQLIRGMGTYYLSALNNSLVSQQQEVQRLESNIHMLETIDKKNFDKKTQDDYAQQIAQDKIALEEARKDLKERTNFHNEANNSITNFINGQRPNAHELRKNILNGMGASNNKDSKQNFAHDNGVSNNQNDAAELILKLLKLSGVDGPKVQSTLTTVRQGATQTTTTSKNEAILALQIASQGTKTTLQDCLDKFLSEETIDRENLPNVQNTNIKAESATKKLKIENEPEHLVFSLKRYNNADSKNVSGVDVMGKLKLNNKDYQPVSIVCHLGNNPTSGHYVTYQNDGGTWKLINDDTVTEVTNMDSPYIGTDSHRDIINKNAYVIDLRKV
jgi:ubiquitin C-terminal hydrolase